MNMGCEMTVEAQTVSADITPELRVTGAWPGS